MESVEVYGRGMKGNSRTVVRGRDSLVRRMLTDDVSFMFLSLAPKTDFPNSLRKSALQPRSRKTPRGGRMIAKTILMISLQAKGCQREERALGDMGSVAFRYLFFVVDTEACQD